CRHPDYKGCHDEDAHRTRARRYHPGARCAPIPRGRAQCTGSKYVPNHCSLVRNELSLDRQRCYEPAVQAHHRANNHPPPRSASVPVLDLAVTRFSGLRLGNLLALCTWESLRTSKDGSQELLCLKSTG